MEPKSRQGIDKARAATTPAATPQKSTPRKHRAALTLPDGRERNPASSQNALADGAACHQVARFYGVTHRKAPATNSPRNNVAGCRHPDAKTGKQIKATSLKNTARSNGLRFTCGPIRPASTCQDATTSGSRKIVA